MRNLCLAAVMGLAACAPQTGSVEGVVYFKATNGEVRTASGTRVLLLSDADSLLAKMRQTCAEYTTANTELYRQSADLSKRIRKEVSQPTLLIDFDAIRALRQRQTNLLVDSTKKLKRTTAARLDRLIWSAVADSAPTRLDARFRFANVRPGRFLLWAEDSFGDDEARWLAPVTIEVGKTDTVDLNPERETEGFAAYCFIRRAELR